MSKPHKLLTYGSSKIKDLNDYLKFFTKHTNEPSLKCSLFNNKIIINNDTKTTVFTKLKRGQNT